MSIILYLIGVVSVFFYLNRKYILYLLCYMALMTSCFMFLPSEETNIRGTDIALISTIVIIALSFDRLKLNCLFKDKYLKYVKYLLAYLVFELVLTVMTGADSIGFAAKVVRIPLLILTFFIVRIIPLNKIKSFFKYAFYITIADCVLYYLEFLGVDLLPNVKPLESMTSLGFASSCDIPVLSIIFLFCCITKDIIKRYRIILLFFFIGILVLTFVRTFLISFVVCTGVYLFIKKQDKKLIFKYAILSLLLYPIIEFSFNQKNSATASSKGDIENILNGNFMDPTSNVDAANGTFVFRLSMVVERVQYLLANPQYLLTGVGAIHEDSPKCHSRFNFYLGTLNEGRLNGICIIESGDNTWVPIVLRYGLLGTCFYLYFFVLIFNNVRKRKDEYVIIAPIVFFYFLSSFSGPFFERSEYYLIIVLLLGLMSRLEYEEFSIILQNENK